MAEVLTTNRSRRNVEPPPNGVVTREAPVLPPMPGILTKDAPAPLEAFWRRRMPGQHAIPYEQLTVRKSLAIYDAMLQNETVSYGHGLKRTALMASGWSIACPEDSDGDPIPGSEAVRDLVMAVIEQWERFDEFLEQMFDGTRQGYKLAEIVTKDGKVDGRRGWAIEDCLVRNSRFISFDVDPAGRLLDDGVLEYIDPNPDGGGIASYWPSNATARHAPSKFVIWSWNGLDSNAYSLFGRSDFYAAYRSYFVEDLMLKGWAETLDTYKHPTAVAIMRNALSAPQVADFLNALTQGLKRKAILIPQEYIPDGMDATKAVSLHEVTGKAKDFEGISGKLDTKIMRALFVGQLVAETGGDGRGSYALGKQHVSIFLKIMDAVGRSLGRAIGRGLFQKIVRWNLGEDAVPLTPTLKFNAAGDSETLERTQVIQALVEGGVVDPSEKWLREYLGNFPKMDPEIQARVEKERELRLKKETDIPKPAPGGGRGNLSITDGQAEALGSVVDDVRDGTLGFSDGVVECMRIGGLSRGDAVELLREARSDRKGGAKPAVSTLGCGEKKDALGSDDVHLHLSVNMGDVKVERGAPPIVNVAAPPALVLPPATVINKAPDLAPTPIQFSPRIETPAAPPPRKSKKTLTVTERDSEGRVKKQSIEEE